MGNILTLNQRFVPRDENFFKSISLLKTETIVLRDIVSRFHSNSIQLQPHLNQTQIHQNFIKKLNVYLEILNHDENQNFITGQIHETQSVIVKHLCKFKARYFDPSDSLSLLYFSYKQDIPSKKLSRLIERATSKSELYGIFGRFKLSLEYGLITITCYQSQYRLFSVEGIDFVSINHPVMHQLKTICSKSDYQKFRKFLNNLVFHVLYYFDQISHFPIYTQSLSLEKRKILESLKQSIPQKILNVFTFPEEEAWQPNKFNKFLKFSLLPVREISTSLMLQYLQIAAEINDWQVLVSLIQYNHVDINTKSNFNWTLIVSAVQNRSKNCYDILRRLSPNFSLESYGFDGWPIIMYATLNNTPELLKDLIDSGANVNLIDFNNNTALITACQNGLSECARILIHSGVIIDQQNVEGFNALHLAARSGHVEMLKLLVEYGASIHLTCNNGLNAIHCAALNGYTDCVEFLIQQGVNVNLVCNEGKSPLMYATQYGHLNTAKLLIENNGDINTQDIRGMTALMHTARNGNHECVKFLIDNGSNCQIQDNDGNIALNHAQLSKSADCISLLK